MKKEPELGSNIWFLASFFVFQAGSPGGLSFWFSSLFDPFFWFPTPLFSHLARNFIWENRPFYSATVQQYTVMPADAYEMEPAYCIQSTRVIS
jgi:hypothetical protein